MAKKDPSNKYNDPFARLRQQMADSQQRNQLMRQRLMATSGTSSAQYIQSIDPSFLQAYGNTITWTGGVFADNIEEPKPKPVPEPKRKIKFDSVIMPESKKQAILNAVNQVKHNDLIFKTWGFEEVFEKGTAISMLFYGPPGTGKTLMGQAIADHFDYKLKVVDTASIESSEPGQAERNIKGFFEAANKDGKTVLLFDECDSLIHDRNAVGMILGAQINALLTSLENYKGIAIFTTNRLGRLDPAFDRRLSLKLEFEMPTVELRIEIWKNMFPKKAPLAKDIDWESIASVEIAGGHIKNVVLRAARAAANSKDKKITHRVLVTALREEVESTVQFQEALKDSTLPHLRGYQGPGIVMGGSSAGSQG